MIKVTILTKNKECNELGSFKIVHMTMFDKLELGMIFLNTKEMLNAITILQYNYVLFKIQGLTLTIIPEDNNLQRVRFRFDAVITSI